MKELLCELTIMINGTSKEMEKEETYGGGLHGGDRRTMAGVGEPS